MSDKPPKISTPPPKKTRSGEMPAVRTFQEEIEKYNEEIVPQMDEQLDRMNELFKKVTIVPAEDGTKQPSTPMPPPPRVASFVDPSELSNTPVDEDELDE